MKTEIVQSASYNSCVEKVSVGSAEKRAMKNNLIQLFKKIRDRNS